MKKIVELPIIEPMYGTYHNQGPGSAILSDNLSIRNWYINEAVNLTCMRRFLSGFSSPDLTIVNSLWIHNPYLEIIWIDTKYLKGYIHPIIRNLINNGYYVCFDGIDDYYVKGKSWYKEKHFYHDGCICGYNQENKTYCLYAYDSNWVYRKFWTPQSSFDAGRKAAFKQGKYGYICGIKPKTDKVEFSLETVVNKLKEYLDSSMEKYPEEGEGDIYGIVVHDYIAKYVGKLFDGSIPYERMDRRIFRLIWEHKKVMLERIKCIENVLKCGIQTSKEYETVVAEANAIRMMYASHHMKRRDSLLPVIQKKLISLKEKEKSLLEILINKAEGAKK